MTDIFFIVDYLPILNLLDVFMQYIPTLEYDCYKSSCSPIRYEGISANVSRSIGHIVNQIRKQNIDITNVFEDFINSKYSYYIDCNMLVIEKGFYICCLLFLTRSDDKDYFLIYEIKNSRYIYFDSKKILSQSLNKKFVKYHDEISIQTNFYLYLISKKFKDFYNIRFVESKYMKFSEQNLYLQNIMQDIS